MAKKSKNPLILVGVTAVLALVGVIAYVVMQKDKQDNQPPDSQTTLCTTYNGTIKEQCIKNYIGLSISEAVSKAEENGLFPKTAKKDGKTQGFNDIGAASIYFEIEKGIVTRAYFEDDRK